MVTEAKYYQVKLDDRSWTPPPSLPLSRLLRFLLELLTKQFPTIYPTAVTGKTLWCGLWAFLTAGKDRDGLHTFGCTLRPEHVAVSPSFQASSW